MSSAAASGSPRGALALLALLLVTSTAALAQIWASAHLREAARATARFERLYHASMIDAAAWRDKHDAQAKALDSARGAVAAAQRSGAALQAKKSELKAALREVEERALKAEREADDCRADAETRAGAADGETQTQTQAQTQTHGKRRGGSAPPDGGAAAEADGEEPTPQRGGENRTPDAHAAAIDLEAAARDEAAANGGS